MQLKIHKGNQRCWSPVCGLKGVHVSTHSRFQEQNVVCWRLLDVDHIGQCQCGTFLKTIDRCLNLFIVHYGSRSPSWWLRWALIFQGWSASAGPAGPFANSKFCPWSHMWGYYLGNSPYRNRLDLMGPFPPALRKAGLDYSLRFISEVNPSLRSLVESIHQPKCVYEELWIARMCAWMDGLVKD